MRKEALRFVLLAGLLALCACGTGSNYVNPASRLTYACNGADNMISYSACDRPDRFGDLQQMHEQMHQHDGGANGPEPPVGTGDAHTR